MQPLGRPIEVEGGLGDRRPSADSRKQRIRDSDSVCFEALQLNLDCCLCECAILE